MIATASGISASMASLMAGAAIGGGTKIPEAVAAVCLTASATLAKTGCPK